MKLNLVLPYKLTEGDKASSQPTEAISAFLIRTAIHTKWPDRMPRTDSRIWAAIQDALIDDPPSLDLSVTDFKWLREHVCSHDFPAKFSPYRWVLVDYLEGLKPDDSSERERLGG